MLTPDQLHAIDRHLRKSGIIYQEVYDELFDHFVNAIEAELANHKPFDLAMDDISRQFGGRKGLIFIQAQRNKTANLHYRQRLWNQLVLCIQWPTITVTLALAWLLYALISLAPTMQAVTYPAMVITAIPFLLITTLSGRHLWQFIRRKRPAALSLEGFTLLSKSLGTVLAFVYPNMFIQLGLIVPKQMPLNSTERVMFFLILMLTFFISFVQIRLIIGYAKSFAKTPNYLSN